jgi:hypothetical protein
MLDETKIQKDEIEEVKEDIRKGDVEPEEVVPEHETDSYTDMVMEDLPKEVLGRYQKVGECRYCGATVYVEEYSAAKVARPRLIYTCEEWCLAGFKDRDVMWAPKYFGAIDLSNLGKQDEDS